MKALILAGGFGTRLRPLSCTRPKILFPILNKPLLQWILERLAQDNIKEAILAVNNHTEFFIKEHGIPRCRVHISFSRDLLKKPLGTGGPIKRAEKLIGHDKDFLVLNGDIFADINYQEILKEHKRKNAIATIALHRVNDPSRYGVAELAKQNRIAQFIEKPPPNEAPTNLANAGIYILNPEIFTFIPKGKRVSLEREVFPKLSKEGRLYGYIFEGLWKDMGKLEDYFETNRILLDTIQPQARHGSGDKFKVKEPVTIHEEVSIGAKSVIGPYTVLGQNTLIGESVHIQNSVVFPGTSISDFSTINGALIGEDVVIGRNVKIKKGCTLGDYVRIMDDVTLAEGVSICSAKQVSESVLTPSNII